MAIYSMVKTNTFNGMPLASILAVDSNQRITTVKEFGYETFKDRLS
jgi:carboxynorspermidine decarboxylase